MKRAAKARSAGVVALPTSLAKPCATCRGMTVLDRTLSAPEDDIDVFAECPDC